MTGIRRPAEGEKLAAAQKLREGRKLSGRQKQNWPPVLPVSWMYWTKSTRYECYYLNHETPWQLLIAVIMSAQCTDARVNIVIADLFQKYDTLEKFAAADLKELEQDIHSIGFYHMKAKNIIACCRDLVERFGGEVPRTIEELTSLAGVGRKTANVIRGNIYNEPSIVVDTHVKRISGLGY